MVDFNNESTITRAAVDIERVLILQKREDFINAYSEFVKQGQRGVQASTHVISGCLQALYLQLDAMLQERFKDEEHLTLLQLLESEDPKELLVAFQMISKLLREIQLTKIDLKRQLGGNISDRNKSQGWNA